jgi:peptide chain release factor 1
MQLPRIDPFRQRFAEVEALMNAPDFYQDSRRAAVVGREHQQLQNLLELSRRREELSRIIAENRTLVEDASAEAELKEMAEEELPQLESDLVAVEEKMLFAMVPPDPTDSRNTVVEIRAGTGGEEASLFAADLYRMYQRFAERQGWKVEVLSTSESDSGGFKEIIALISGEDVYRFLKYESGVHRVQRVPRTEANGRIHTSTATVAVLPEAEEVDVHIDPNDLEITVARASGPGGQGVNTTDSAVQMLHKPTGLRVYCADERSQLKNKIKALQVLRARLLQQKEEEERAKYAAERRGQIGSGDRSERIRTYNFPQSRLTDHRVGLTLHSLDEVMEGDIFAIIEALSAADQEARVAEVQNRESSAKG